ncbi:MULTISPECIES: hypothetical protein [Rhodomicrobium]|uniref:hypothetical protein n=1 Tax=Rhodomicrobium TaxID=1068 RepID=UPI000B4B6A03|nr:MULTISPECIES: hypothetical protein [Rhodomicrobium]
MQIIGKSALTAALIASSLGAASLTAFAKTNYDTVTVTGDFKDQRITAPVRIRENGARHVRIPGGGWVDCASDCKQTLRDATVDFWGAQDEEIGGGGGGDGGGGGR